MNSHYQEEKQKKIFHTSVPNTAFLVCWDQEVIKSVGFISFWPCCRGCSAGWAHVALRDKVQWWPWQIWVDDCWIIFKAFSDLNGFVIL